MNASHLVELLEVLLERLEELDVVVGLLARKLDLREEALTENARGGMVRSINCSLMEAGSAKGGMARSIHCFVMEAGDE